MWLCAWQNFFAGYKVKPGGISFIMHADGRPSGMAFVEFEMPQEAMRAMVRARHACRGCFFSGPVLH